MECPWNDIESMAVRCTCNDKKMVWNKTSRKNDGVGVGARGGTTLLFPPRLSRQATVSVRAVCVWRKQQEEQEQNLAEFYACVETGLFVYVSSYKRLIYEALWPLRAQVQAAHLRLSAQSAVPRALCRAGVTRNKYLPPPPHLPNHPSLKSTTTKKEGGAYGWKQCVVEWSGVFPRDRAHRIWNVISVSFLVLSGGVLVM